MEQTGGDEEISVHRDAVNVLRDIGQRQGHSRDPLGMPDKGFVFFEIEVLGDVLEALPCGFGGELKPYFDDALS